MSRAGDGALTLGEILHAGLPAQQRLRARDALGSAIALIQKCIETGHSGDVTVTLDAGRIIRVEGSIDDGETATPIHFHDWTGE